MKTVTRYDAIPLTRAVKTPEGYVLAEGVAAKVGIMSYRQADGSIVREYVPPETLFDSESLGTLGRKPVTYDHPVADGKPVNVDSTNVQEYGVGDVDGELEVVREAQGGFVRVKVALRRQDAVEAVLSGRMKGLSPGYSVDLDPTPGEWQGQKYDAVQRNRRYNHLAVCQMGRGGPDVRLRADSLDGVQVIDADEENAMEQVEVKIGERTLKLDADDATALAKERTDAATWKSQLDTCTKQMDELKAGFDAQMAELKKQRDELQAKMAEKEAKMAEMEQANCDAATKADSEFLGKVNARLDLLKTAEKLGVEKADTMSDADIKRAIVQLHNPELKLDSVSGDYVSAYVDVLKAQYQKVDAPVKPVKQDAPKNDAMADYMANTYGVEKK
jgi:uncharacterized protein